MPFCPECRYEYRVEAKICPDCNQQLVEHLAVERAAGPPDDEWVPAGRVQTTMKAELARGALESNEIPIVMVTGAAGNIGTGSSGVSQLTGDGSGGFTILVHSEQVAEAQYFARDRHARRGHDMADAGTCRG